MLRRNNPNIFILYDEAQSFGASDNDGLQCREADGVLISLGLGKVATSLSGGILLLRDPDIANRVRKIRDTEFRRSSPTRKLKLVVSSLVAIAAYTEPLASVIDQVARRSQAVSQSIHRQELTENTELPSDALDMPSDLEATIGLRQLKRLEALLQDRRRIGLTYEKSLSAQGLSTFAYRSLPSWPRYPYAVLAREDAIAKLREQGVQVGLFLNYECSGLPLYQGSPRCVNAAFWAQTMINLPNWHGLSLAQAERIVREIVRLRLRPALPRLDQR